MVELITCIHCIASYSSQTSEAVISIGLPVKQMLRNIVGLVQVDYCMKLLLILKDCLKY